MIERLRILGASLDGSLLDDDTWRARHRYVVLCGGVLTLFILAYSLTDPTRPEEWVYTGAAALALSLSTVQTWSRRVREVLMAVCFMAAQLYVTRFVGNFTLGPLAVIVLSFYQDWVPVVIGCLETIAVAILAWADPALFRGAAALASQSPGPGLTLRALAILLAAALSLAIWRSGTQLARDQLTGMLSRLGCRARPRPGDGKGAQARRLGVRHRQLQRREPSARGQDRGHSPSACRQQPAARRRLAAGRLVDGTPGRRHLPDRPSREPRRRRRRGVRAPHRSRGQWVGTGRWRARSALYGSRLAQR